MVKMMRRHRKRQNKSYRQMLSRTQAHLKLIKNNYQPQPLHMQNDIAIGQIDLSAILCFMSQPLAYSSQDYGRSIVILDNLFVLNRWLLHEANLNHLFTQNISRYFVQISVQQQLYHNNQVVQYHQLDNPAQNSKIVLKRQNKLYSCLYFILLLIHRGNQNYLKQNFTLKAIFTSQFLRRFVQLQISNYSVKLTKVYVMILAYFCIDKCKVLSQNSWILPQIKCLTLNLVQKTRDSVTNTYLILILKSQLSRITSQQLHRYRISNYLIECLGNGHQKTVKSSLEAINYVVKTHPQMINEFLNLKLMKYWDINIASFPTICVELLKSILPGFAVDKKWAWFSMYINHIIIYIGMGKISHVHFSIVECLLKEISNDMVLQLIQHGWINTILVEVDKLKSNRQIYKNQDLQKLIAQLDKLRGVFHKRIQYIDENLYRTFLLVSQL